MEIKSLNIADISSDLLIHFSHEQMITQKWIKNDGEWKLCDTSELREWSLEKEFGSQSICVSKLTVAELF